jgi:Xaa-Pro aminopeptidase
MRRGLMRWDPQELPATALADRLGRLRAMMRKEGFGAFLIYTNLVRPSAVNWLTGFTPYWSEGALLVLDSGAPLFVTALSKRVANWMRTTDPISEIVNAPRPGKLIGERLAQNGAIRRLGVLELDTLPTGLYDDLVAAAPSLTIADASAVFAGVRRSIDDAERGLLAHADRLAGAALKQVVAATEADAGTIAGLVEQHARLAGAEEAYIAVAADLASDRRLLRIVKPTPLGRYFAVRASVAYKGAWVRRTRTFARDAADARDIAQAEAWLAGLATALDLAKPLALQLAGEVRKLRDATLGDWMLEGCVGSYPLQVVATARGAGQQSPGPVEFAVLTVGLTIAGTPWIGAMPVIAGREERPRA